ncbi:MAG: hypothetical protein ACK4VO_13105 [Pseudobdellovibrio sp.]
MSEIIHYRKSAVVTIFYLLFFIEILCGAIFIIFDILNIGTMKRQDALGGGLFLLSLSIFTIIYIYMIDFELILHKETLEIKRNFFLKSYSDSYSYEDIKKVDVGIVLKTLSIEFKNKRSIYLSFLHERIYGELPNNSNIGASNGQLRELQNLKYEITQRSISKVP